MNGCTWSSTLGDIHVFMYLARLSTRKIFFSMVMVLSTVWDMTIAWHGAGLGFLGMGIHAKLVFIKCLLRSSFAS